MKQAKQINFNRAAAAAVLLVFGTLASDANAQKKAAKSGSDASSAILASETTTPTKPFGNPNAPQGGTFNQNLKAEPTTLNPITSTDLYARDVQGWVLDSLMERDPDTYKWMPALAEKVEIAPDGRA